MNSNLMINANPHALSVENNCNKYLEVSRSDYTIDYNAKSKPEQYNIQQQDERVSKQTRFIHCSALIGCIIGLSLVVCGGMCLYLFWGSYSVNFELRMLLTSQQIKTKLGDKTTTRGVDFNILYAGLGLFACGLVILGFGFVMCCWGYQLINFCRIFSLSPIWSFCCCQK